MGGTMLCDGCWELSGRINKNPAAAKALIEEIDRANNRVYIEVIGGKQDRKVYKKFAKTVGVVDDTARVVECLIPGETKTVVYLQRTNGKMIALTVPFEHSDFFLAPGGCK
jgi:hypothetical protein